MSTTIKHPKVSIVVPVYNSSQILPVLASRIKSAMKQDAIDYEVIFCEDCGPDDSWDVIQDLCSNNSNFKGNKNQQNLGLPFNALRGMSIAEGDFIVTIDDDLEYDPSDIPRLLQHIEENDFDVVFGLAPEKYRSQGKSTSLALFRNRILNFLWNKPITDSFKIVRRDVLFAEAHFLPQAPFEGYLKQHIPREKIGYLRVSFQERYSGVSNYTFYKKLRLFWQMSRSFWLGK
jgi:polyisoprenyl-phosphate glycosyltransferase